MPNFKVSILLGQDMKEIGSFTYNHTVLQLKRYYYDKIDNSVPVNKLRFRYQGKDMEDHKTLGYYDDDVDRFGMVIQYFARLLGGGSTPTPGPNTNAALKQKNWSGGSAPDYRVHGKGLCLEWKYNDDGTYRKIIGTLGFGKFNMNRDSTARQAYCKHFKTRCPGKDKITNYYFNNCKVDFDGELADKKRTVIKKTQTFGDKCCRYEGGTILYNDLQLTVRRL